MRHFFKKVFANWMINRQLTACAEVLNRHSYHLGPEHQKDVRQLMAKLESQRGQSNTYM